MHCWAFTEHCLLPSWLPNSSLFLKQTPSQKPSTTQAALFTGPVQHTVFWLLWGFFWADGYVAVTFLHFFSRHVAQTFYCIPVLMQRLTFCNLKRLRACGVCERIPWCCRPWPLVIWVHFWCKEFIFNYKRMSKCRPNDCESKICFTLCFGLSFVGHILKKRSSPWTGTQFKMHQCRFC